MMPYGFVPEDGCPVHDKYNMIERLWTFVCRLWLAAMLALGVFLYAANLGYCLLGGCEKANEWWSRVIGW